MCKTSVDGRQHDYDKEKKEIGVGEMARRIK